MLNTIDIFPWNENFNTGVDLIDKQHHELVNILNRLASQIAEKADEKVLGKIFEELSLYTVYHFDTEESYWSKYLKNDEAEHEHQAVHQKFITKIEALKKEQKTKPLIEIIEDALEFLANWLASHILETDREMAYTVAAMQEGMVLEEAKKSAKERMNDSSHAFIEIILNIYATLSQNTLKLIKELQLNKKYDDAFVYEYKYRELLLELSTSFINLPPEQLSEKMQDSLEKMAHFVDAKCAYIFYFNDQLSKPSDLYEWSINDASSTTQEHKQSSFSTISLWLEQEQKGNYVPIYQNDSCVGFIGFDRAKEKQEFTDSEITILNLFARLFANVNKRKESEKSLRLAASVFTHSHEGIMITSVDNKIIDVNAAVTEITGYTKEELIGKNPKILSSGKNSSLFYEKMWQSINEKDYWSGEIWNRHKSGEAYAEMLTLNAVRDNKNKIINYIALFSDITSIKKHEGHIEYIAHYDALTGLPNRVLLADRLKQAIAQTQRKNTSIAIVYLDLDGFKEVNDTYGHDYGDSLLCVLSQKMQNVLRLGDTIARIGGDEFIAVLSELHSHEESLPLLERLLKSVCSPVDINAQLITVSASLGVTFFNAGDSTDPDQLMRYADQAMYQAKLAGKNRYHVFDPVADATIRTHHKKIETIELALRNEEFMLYYQPKVNMHSGEILGFEALIRWNHPTAGILAPSFFLPSIEEHPLSIHVGEWVLEEACKEILYFKEKNLKYTISVNINAMHLLKGNFIAKLESILKKYPTIKKGDLVIEILETSALEDLSYVSNIIREAQKLGVAFALDDFGTGYSSLTYLKQLAVSQIKIDQSFIRDMLNDSDDLAIIEGVITLANAFHREIVAEGVESVEHGEVLLKLGCQVAQGYAIAKPMPAQEIIEWIENYKPQIKWQNIKPLNNEKISYLHAMAEHNAWIKELIFSLENNTPLTLELNSELCHFGSWIKSDPQGDSNTIEQLKKIHSELHRLAILYTSQMNQSGNLNEKLNELKTKSQELINLLKQMCAS